MPKGTNGPIESFVGIRHKRSRRASSRPVARLGHHLCFREVGTSCRLGELASRRMPFHVGEYIDRRQSDLEVWRGFCVIGGVAAESEGKTPGTGDHRKTQSIACHLPNLVRRSENPAACACPRFSVPRATAFEEPPVASRIGPGPHCPDSAADGRISGRKHPSRPQMCW